MTEEKGMQLIEVLLKVGLVGRIIGCSLLSATVPADEQSRTKVLNFIF